MMEDGTTGARIKQEIDTSCCSPSPSSQNVIIGFGANQDVSIRAVRTTDLNLNFNKFQIEYKCGSDAANNMNSEPSPGSPDRQFCSSTTSAIGDFGNESNMQEVKEEIPR